MCCNKADPVGVRVLKYAEEVYNVFKCTNDIPARLVHDASVNMQRAHTALATIRTTSAFAFADAPLLTALKKSRQLWSACMLNNYAIESVHLSQLLLVLVSETYAKEVVLDSSSTPAPSSSLLSNWSNSCCNPFATTRSDDVQDTRAIQVAALHGVAALCNSASVTALDFEKQMAEMYEAYITTCLLYTSPSPRD